MDQRAAQTQFLFHAAREFARGPVEKRVQAGCLGQPVDPRLALGGALAKQFAEKIQILGDAQLLVEVLAEPLGHIGNARTDTHTLA